ncbi:MAG: hypothetical protein ACI92Z_002239 [Paracoccaceae bacterium]
MCALAHYLEDAGIATVVISLIRLHAEKTRPPRALFVPFELGRPLGDPRDVAGQRDVLKHVLSLLDHCGPTPMLADYPEPMAAPVGQPIDLPVDADLMLEFDGIEAVYNLFVAEHGSTTFGNSGMTPGDVVAAINGLLTGESMGGKRIPSKLLRFMVDDLKTLYFEAACQGRILHSSAQLGAWFWRKTAAGKAIVQLRSEFLQSDDKGRQKIASFMVPGAWVDDLGLT